MFVNALKVNYLRNLVNVDASFHAPLVIFSGLNGSGKTSLLEALYFLGYGRSFQSRLLNRIVHYGQPGLSVFGEVCTDQHALALQVGIAKSLHEPSQIRLNGKTIMNASELALHMPMQLIHPESFHLLTGGSQARRQFLDWGLFHVEPQFHALWQKSQRLVLQRNAALRSEAPDDMVMLWDQTWVGIAETIDTMRRAYVDSFLEIYAQVADTLQFQLPVELHYHRGWSEEQDLASLLKQQLAKDRTRHYTYSGPQRADIIIKLAGVPVADALSRGQQKLLLMVLFLTQAQLLYQRAKKKSCYLLDDILAEFDPTRRQQILQSLTQLSSQVFLTTPDLSQLGDLAQLGAYQLFHVEQGVVREHEGYALSDLSAAAG